MVCSLAPASIHLYWVAVRDMAGLKYFYEMALSFCPALQQSGPLKSIAVVLPHLTLLPLISLLLCALPATSSLMKLNLAC